LVNLKRALPVSALLIRTDQRAVRYTVRLAPLHLQNQQQQLNQCRRPLLTHTNGTLNQ
jgi:hypothetical protein